MRSAVNGAIIFGLVNVPVGVASATKTTNDPSFRILHRVCGNPVSVKRPAEASGAASTEATPEGETSLSWCATCGIEATETIRGFEYAKGEYVTFTEEEMDALHVTRSPVIQIKKFVKTGEIKPVMIDKHYFLIPNKALAENYGLLYQALAETKMAGIGTQTLWGKEHPCAVVANQDYEGGVMMLQTLKLYEDLAKPDFSAPIPNKEAKRLAKLMVGEYADDFEPMVDLTSEQRINVWASITAKIEGKEPPSVPGEAPREAVPDIQEALRTMIEEKQAHKPPKPARTRTAGKK